MWADHPQERYSDLNQIPFLASWIFQFPGSLKVSADFPCNSFCTLLFLPRCRSQGLFLTSILMNLVFESSSLETTHCNSNEPDPGVSLPGQNEFNLYSLMLKTDLKWPSLNCRAHDSATPYQPSPV